MAMDHSSLLELLEALKAAGVDDRIRLAAQNMYQELIDAEAEGVIGAGLWERTAERTAVRNGSRPRTLSTTAGDLELRIPKLRTGSFFPSLLERRRRVDQALFAVIMEAYLHGVSTRKVDDLVAQYREVRQPARWAAAAGLGRRRWSRALVGPRVRREPGCAIDGLADPLRKTRTCAGVRSIDRRATVARLRR